MDAIVSRCDKTRFITIAALIGNYLISFANSQNFLCLTSMFFG